MIVAKHFEILAIHFENNKCNVMYWQLTIYLFKRLVNFATFTGGRVKTMTFLDNIYLTYVYLYWTVPIVYFERHLKWFKLFSQHFKLISIYNSCCHLICVLYMYICISCMYSSIELNHQFPNGLIQVSWASSRRRIQCYLPQPGSCR